MCLSFIRVTNRNSVEPYNLYAPYSSCSFFLSQDCQSSASLAFWRKKISFNSIIPSRSCIFLHWHHHPFASSLTSSLLSSSLSSSLTSSHYCTFFPSFPFAVPYQFTQCIRQNYVAFKNWTHVRSMDSKVSCNKFYKQLREFKKKGKLKC